MNQQPQSIRVALEMLRLPAYQAMPPVEAMQFIAESAVMAEAIGGRSEGVWYRTLPAVAVFAAVLLNENEFGEHAKEAMEIMLKIRKGVDGSAW